MYDVEREFTISEVSELTGYPAHVIRYYEKEFELDIPRNNVNHRYYTYKELEIFNYIKALQEKGFSNKQIKLIMNSPEMLMSNDETAITATSKKEFNILPNNMEIYNIFKSIIFDELKPILIEKEKMNIDVLSDLRDEIIQLRSELNSKERDILICENMKLKMKIKEKSYEVVELKDKLKRQQESSKGIFKKFFTTK